MKWTNENMFTVVVGNCMNLTTILWKEYASMSSNYNNFLNDCSDTIMMSRLNLIFTSANNCPSFHYLPQKYPYMKFKKT